MVGLRFKMYTEVRRANITASDAATGMIADLECVTENGETFFAVEVKDRRLTIHQIKEKTSNLRGKNVSDIFFIATQDLAPEDKRELSPITLNEFTSKYNIHVFGLMEFSRVLLPLLKEDGRRKFLAEIGSQLDQYSDIHHRRAWAGLLESI